MSPFKPNGIAHVKSPLLVLVLVAGAGVAFAASDSAQSQQLLFAYFDGSQTNGLYLAIRNGQGTWQRLNGGQPVFTAAVGEWKIFRDPHLSREHDGRWRIVWTTGSNSYGFTDSADLVTFSPARAITTNTGITGGFKYTWAPEINWDAVTASYLITWSSTLATSSGDWMNDGDHRIYAHNTKDFITFTPSRKFYDPGYTCIDSNLIQQGEQWRLFFKDERSGYKAIRVTSSTSLDGPWSAPSEPITPAWSEGPTIVPEAGGYSLYFDYFTRNGVYGVITGSDLKTWSAPQDVPTGFGVRHGSFVWITSAEADQLRAR